jgi:hypothetical protein
MRFRAAALITAFYAPGAGGFIIMAGLHQIFTTPPRLYWDRVRSSVCEQLVASQKTADEEAFMVKVKYESDWSYKTSSGVSVGGEVVGAGGGTLLFRSPGKVVWHYLYGSAGLGASLGIMNVSISKEDTPSAGWVGVLEGCPGPDLTADDLEGFCTVQSISVSAMAGGNLAVMFLGIDLEDLAFEVGIDMFSLSLVGQLLDRFADIDWPKILRSKAKGLLIMGGAMVSGIGLSAMGSVGYVAKPGGATSGVLKALEKYALETNAQH